MNTLRKQSFSTTLEETILLYFISKVLRTNLILFLFVLIGIPQAYGQLPFTEGFEAGSGGFTSSITECTDAGTDYFLITDGTDISAGVVLTGVTGTNFFGAQDVDAAGCPAGGASETLIWSGIDITACTTLSLSLDVAEDDAADAAEDWDANSSMLVEAQIDGGGYTTILQFESVGGTNTEPAQDTDFDGVGDGTNLTGTFQTFTNSIAGTGASLDIRITFSNLGAGDEDVAIDELIITGSCVACTPDAEPTTNSSASAFSNVGCSTMDLAWTNGDGANRIVVMSTAAIAGTPTDQTDYTASSVFGSGSTIAAGEFVIYNGAGSAVSVTGLAASTTYHIAIFEYNGTSANCTENYFVSSAHTNSQATVACGAGLIINEIYVNTGVNDGSPNPDTGEWIEFYNESSTPIDVSCYAFCDGDFCVTFPSGTIIAGQDYYLVGSAVGVACGGCDFPGQAMDLDWGTSGCANGTTIGTFTNGAEQVALFDNAGAIVDAVEWGGGQSLPTTMSTVAGCGCGSQSVTLPLISSGEYESLGSTTDQTSFERAVDASGTWTTETVPTVDATNGAALPVSLLSFTGEKYGDDHKLLWTTASEENNYGFEIWRSADGIRFEFIGFQDGVGTTSEANSYELIDHNPLNGINYYRLTQIDFNGDRTKYQVIALNNESDVLSINSWSTENELTEVKIDGFHERMPINVNIIDISGRIVYTEVHQPSSNLYLNGFAFSHGVYILSIEQGGQRAMEKLKF